MWVHELEGAQPGYSGRGVAINRAVGLNRCASENYEFAPKESFPIGGGNSDDLCQQLQGCDPLYPLVVCELPSNGQSSNDDVVNPGFSTFIRSFSQGDFVSQ
jgi:hypothetical protein